VTVNDMMPPTGFPELAVADFRPQTDAEGHERLDRLRLLDIEQLTMTLAFLAGYRPAVFDAVLDALEPGAEEGVTLGGEAEPCCTSCGASVGIFLGHGTDWRHFRDGAGRAEVFEADHAAVIGWRYVPAGR
jgi:hypothetical protein